MKKPFDMRKRARMNVYSHLTALATNESKIKDRSTVMHLPLPTIPFQFWSRLFYRVWHNHLHLCDRLHVLSRIDELEQDLELDRRSPGGRVRMNEYSFRQRFLGYSSFSAGAAIPVLCANGQQDRALSLGERLLDSHLSSTYQNVVGVGSEGDLVGPDEPRNGVRHIVLSLSLWSLAAYLGKTDLPPRGLYNFLKRLESLETLNPCVLTSIGALALLAVPEYGVQPFSSLLQDAADGARSIDDHDLENAFLEPFENQRTLKNALC